MSALIPATGTDGGATINELPSLLKRWMTIQEEMSTLNSELKQRRTQSKALRDVILRIMETNNVVKLNVNRGAVVHKTREVAEKISNTYMLKHFKDFFSGDEEKAKSLIAYLETNRGTVVKHDLKLQAPAGSDEDSGPS
jgi:hypothetical protein